MEEPDGIVELLHEFHHPASHFFSFEQKSEFYAQSLRSVYSLIRMSAISLPLVWSDDQHLNFVSMEWLPNRTFSALFVSSA